MSALTISGYKFISLSDCDNLQNNLHALCQQYDLKGTILLSIEGININLAGAETAIFHFIQTLKEDVRFADMVFHHITTTVPPYKRLKVKKKKEIIAFRQPYLDFTKKRAPAIPPQLFKHWLDSKRDITILDTRNDYEYRFGSFDQAINLHLNDFCEFPNAIEGISKSKPIVMFCTGGIRCEKAAVYMLSQGFTEVYQLDGGILGYFKQVGGSHYHGSCFVFDDRTALNADLNQANVAACLSCQKPLSVEMMQDQPQFCDNCQLSN